uniref:Enhancer of polycomb-like protein n=1 Tax=Mesocestoides corti TaxID=53468 RepID=A0A5K3ERW4_MESCO
MSKVSFRTRQIDFNRSLSIVRYDSDLFCELGEGAFVNRGTPTVPSGMEREEENEHHFLEVLQALQLQKNTDVSIPVPEIIDKSEAYEKVYSANFSLPKNLIHIRTIALEDDEPVEYDMDSDDEDWLRRSDLNLSPEKFEKMIDRLERGCGQRVMNLEEARLLLNDDPSLVIAVYDYWLNKRVQCRQPLLLSVRQEKRDGGSNNDPYVAFRRRTERMQTRKNRKNDEYSYEKMLLLREQMVSLGEIVSRLVKRESTKEAVLEIERKIFQSRYKLGDWEATQLSEADVAAQKSPKSFERLLSLNARKHISSRKRKLSRHSPENAFGVLSDTSDTEINQTLSDPFAFVRLPGCKYQRPLDLRSIPEIDNEATFCLSRIKRVSHHSQHSYTGYLRRRLGRGGRILYDRLPAPSDDLNSYFNQLNSRSPPPEVQELRLRRFTGVDQFVPCEGTTAESMPNKRISAAPCPSLSYAHEDVLFKRLQLSLRNQSRHQLTLSLSKLTCGRRLSSGWLGSSGSTIYPHLPTHHNVVNRTSVRSSSSPRLTPATGFSVVKSAPNTVPAKPVVLSKNKNHHHWGVEATFPRDGGGNAVTIARGRVAPLGGSAAAILAATVSIFPKGIKVCGPVASPPLPLAKKSLLNGDGGGTALLTSPKDDSAIPWLSHQVTPIRKTSAAILSASVKNSATQEDGTTGADGKNSIIQPVVYNV